MNSFKENTTFFLLLFYCLSFAQTNKENVESQTYKSLKDSIHKYSKADTKKTISYAHSYLSKARNKNNKAEEFTGYQLLYIIYFNRKDFEKALETIQVFLDFAKKNNLREELLRAYHLKSTFSIYNKGLTDLEVLANYYQGLNFAKEIDNNLWESKFLNDISVFHFHSENYNKALDFNKKAISKIKKVTDTLGKERWDVSGIGLRGYYSRATEIYLALKNIDSSIYYNYLLNTRLDSSLIHNKFYEKQYYFNRAEINVLKKGYDIAEINYIRAFKGDSIYKKYRDLREILSTYSFGKLDFLNEKYESAIRKFNTIDTIKLSAKKNKSVYLNDYYKMLYKSYIKINDHKKAEYYFERYLLSITRKNNLNDSIKSKFKEIEIREYNKELQLVKTKNNKQSYLIIFISFLFFVVVTGSSFYNRNLKKKNKQKFNTLIQKLENAEKIIETTTVNLNPKLEINDSKIQTILEGIKLLEQKRYFLNIDCSLYSIAKEINTNTTYLSKFINSHYEKNFNAYINELRINYVIQRLKKDRLFRRYSIQSIANEIGFKSKESFNKAFRNQTGHLPSFYIKQLELTA